MYPHFDLRHWTVDKYCSAWQLAGVARNQSTSWLCSDRLLSSARRRRKTRWELRLKELYSLFDRMDSKSETGLHHDRSVICHEDSVQDRTWRSYKKDDSQNRPRDGLGRQWGFSSEATHLILSREGGSSLIGMKFDSEKPTLDSWTVKTPMQTGSGDDSRARAEDGDLASPMCNGGRGVWK